MLSASTLQHIRSTRAPSRYRTTDRFLSRQNEQDKQDATKALQDALQASLLEDAKPLRVFVRDAAGAYTTETSKSTNSSCDNNYKQSRFSKFSKQRQCIITTVAYIAFVNLIIVGTLVVQSGIRTHQWNFLSFMPSSTTSSSFSVANTSKRSVQQSLRGYQTTGLMIHLLLEKELIFSLYEDNLRNVADTEIKFPKSIPYQWQIPESGGYIEDALSTIFGTCIGTPQAGQYPPTMSNTNRDVLPPNSIQQQPHKNNKSNHQNNNFEVQLHESSDSATSTTPAATRPVEIIETPYGPLFNADLYTHEGLERMHTQGILLNEQLSSNIILKSPLLDMTTKLLFQETDHEGRMYGIFSNPIDRIMTYYNRNARLYYSSMDGNKNNNNFDPSFLDLQKIRSLEQYANWPHDRPEFNWLTKTLVAASKNEDRKGQQLQVELPASDELTDHDLQQAKAILARKCLILLKEDDPQVSWNLLQKYLGISINDSQQGKCIDEVLKQTPAGAFFASSPTDNNRLQFSQTTEVRNDNAFEQQPYIYDRKNPIHEQLAERNYWDMQLYAFILELYDYQHTELF